MENTNQLDLLHKPEHWWNADETSFHELELPVMLIEGLEHSTIDYNDIEFVGTNEVVDCMDLTDDCLTPNSTNEEVDCMDLIDGLTPNSMQLPDLQENEHTNFDVNFSKLSCNDKIFRSNVDTGLNMSDFGISNHLSSQGSQSKLSKLSQKIRRDMKELALFSVLLLTSQN